MDSKGFKDLNEKIKSTISDRLVSNPSSEINIDFDNIPKPRYINEYKPIKEIMRLKWFGEKNYFDQLILQTFISLIVVVVLLVVSNVNTMLTNAISDGVRDTINWNVDIDKAVDTFTDIRNMIPNAKKSLEIKTEDGKVEFAANGDVTFIMPVEGSISSEYGERVHPVFKTVKAHNGIDIEGKIGTPIKSSTEGVIKKVGQDDVNGKFVKVSIGEFELTYAHCSKILVKEGQEIEQGEIIAEVGDTGLVTGPHLHFEVLKNGNPVNPMNLPGIANIK